MKFKKENIKLLIDNSFVEPGDTYTYKMTRANLFGGSTKEEVKKDLSGIEFTHPQVNSIIKSYVQFSPDDKKGCKEYLLIYLDNQSDPEASKIALMALIHLNFFDDVFQKISSDFKSYRQNNFYLPLLRTFGDILENEWNILTRPQTDIFYKWIEETFESKNDLGEELSNWPSLCKDTVKELSSIWRKLNIVKTRNLKEDIFSETSQEITSDKSALKLEFKRNNFPEYLNETIDKIDIKISTANDNFDFKGCMDLIRSFSESVFKYIAESLDSIEGKKINGMDSEEAAKFFVKKGLISDNQAKIITSLRHFISNEGVHRLKSRPDDARLSRNMMIELSLYLLLRLKDLKS